MSGVRSVVHDDDGNSQVGRLFVLGELQFSAYDRTAVATDVEFSVQKRQTSSCLL